MNFPPLNMAQLPANYICVVCNQLFANVHQASCGCRYCFRCLEKIIPNKTCVICMESISSEKTPDKAFAKELNALLIKCAECEWRGKMLTYSEHFTATHTKNLPCMFSVIGCVGAANVEHYTTNAPRHMELVFNNLEPRVRDLEQQRIAATAAAGISGAVGGLHVTCATDLGETPVKIRALEADTRLCIQCYEELRNKLKQTQAEVAQLTSALEQTNKNLILTQSTIIGLEERLRAQETMTQTGTLIWRVTSVRDKVAEAKAGRNTSIYSPSFYTHVNGYKMCARLYLNGDGLGRNTHLSVFFVMMRGNYDSLLRWPFRQKVTFLLLDQSQTEDKENIIDAFKPDPNSNSFKRPTSDMNIASGIPLFCPLTKVFSTESNYIKDDTLFLKMIVDSRDLVDI